MATPISKGIGTGAAQVYSFDKTYDALKDVGKALADRKKLEQDEEEYKRKSQQQAAKEDAEVRMMLLKNETDYTKIKPADIPLVQEKARELYTEFAGYGKQLLTDPLVMSNYMNKKNDLDAFVGDRITQKEIALKNLDAISKNGELYTQEDADLEKSKWKEAGVSHEIIAQKMNLPYYLETASNNFSYDNFLKGGAEVEEKYTDENGQTRTRKVITGQTEIPIEEQRKLFWGALGTNAEFKNQINAQLGEDPYFKELRKTNPTQYTKEIEEQAFQNFRAKEKKVLDKQYTNINTVDGEAKNGGFNYDNTNYNVRKTKTKDGLSEIVITTKQGQQPKLGKISKYVDVNGNPITFKSDSKITSVQLQPDGSFLAKISGEYIGEHTDKTGDELVAQFKQGLKVGERQVYLTADDYNNLATRLKVNGTFTDFINNLEEQSVTTTKGAKGAKAAAAKTTTSSAAPKTNKKGKTTSSGIPVD